MGHPMININGEQIGKSVLLKEVVNGTGCLVPEEGMNLLFLISLFFMLGKGCCVLALMLGTGEEGCAADSNWFFWLLLGYSGVLLVTLLKLVLNRKAEISCVISLCFAENASFLPLLCYFCPHCSVAVTESLIKIIKLYIFSNANSFKNVYALGKKEKKGISSLDAPINLDKTGLTVLPNGVSLYIVRLFVIPLITKPLLTA